MLVYLKYSFITLLVTLSLAGCGGGGSSPGTDDSTRGSTTYSQLYSSILADFDGDGHQDLITSGTATGVEIQKGFGDGTFGVKKVLPSRNMGEGQQTIFMSVADFNQDGALDLLTITVDSTYSRMQLQLLKGDGTGQFVDVSATNLPNGGYYQGWAQKAFFVNFRSQATSAPDILLDQAGCSGTCFGGYILVNNGSGVFSENANIIQTITTGSGSSPDAPGSYTLNWLDVPTFGPGYYFSPSGSSNLDLYVKDVDGDGRVDVVSIYGKTTYLNKTTSDGVLKFEVVRWGTATSAEGPYAKAAFVNAVANTGAADYIIASTGIAPTKDSTVGLVAFKNLGGGVFSLDTSVVIPKINLVWSAPHWVVADFNNDGLIDIYIPDTGWDYSPYPGHANHMLQNKGGGVFDAKQISSKNTYTHGACAGDVNGDGLWDLFENNNFVNNPSETSMLAESDYRLFINKGNMSFEGKF